jgi:hypothetical protein
MSSTLAIVAGATVVVSIATVVGVGYHKKSFHEALIEAVFVVSATMMAAKYVADEFDQFFAPSVTPAVRTVPPGRVVEPPPAVESKAAETGLATE